MESLDTHGAVPAQLVDGPRPRAVWLVRDLPAGETRRYRLERVAAAPEFPNVTWSDDGRGLWLAVGNRPVLRYNYAEIPSPAGLDPVYARSGHVHPLLTPGGIPVTDDFPPDHAHQHGLFYAWVNTTFAGRRVDFWNQKERTGRVRHDEILGRAYGPVYGYVSARLLHEDVTKPGQPVPILAEEWTVRVYNRADVFLIDLESTQRAVAATPLQINKYHYGGFGLRGGRQWFDPTVMGDAPPDPARSGESDFLTSESKHRADGNHTRPRWVDLWGKTNGVPAGVAVLDHPGNPGFPQPVRLHPNKPYFCFAPAVLGGFTIDRAHPYVSRYRIALHDARPNAEMIDGVWTDFADPPSARVVSE
jgi:hypothetical protein